MNTTIQCVRGCGVRQAGGTYLCCPTGPGGKPIEYFVLDPIKLWVSDFQRGFKVLPTKFGYNNIAIFVGESFYASCWDFVEETRRFGASRKVSPTFPFEQLTPGMSRMIFIHPSCYVPHDQYPWFEVNLETPLDRYCSFSGVNFIEHFDSPGWHPKVEKRTFCTFNHKNLAYWFHWDKNNPKTHVKSNDTFEVEMPSFSYQGTVPDVPKEVCSSPKVIKEYLLPGAFLSLPLTHVEFPYVENKQAKLRANKAGFETVVLDY